MMDSAIPLIRQIGQSVHEKRSSEGLTQQQLAEKAGVSERLVRSIEKGDAVGARLDKLVAVLSALGLELTVMGADGRLDSRQPSDFIDAEYEDLLNQRVSAWYSQGGGSYE